MHSSFTKQRFSLVIVPTVLCFLLLASSFTSINPAFEYLSEESKKSEHINVQNLASEDIPEPRIHTPMAYDIESDRIVTFSGWSSGFEFLLNDTWAYDFNSNSWENVSSASIPLGRSAHNVAYDSESDRIILFSGQKEKYSYEMYNGTWSFDLNTKTWINMTPISAPNPRIAYGMTYDNDTDRIIIFGGTVGYRSPIAETWTYDYNTNTWTDQAPALSPPARFGHSIIYDSESKLTVLFGGYDSDYSILTDTWVYNSTSNVWTEQSPAMSPQVNGQMVYDVDSDAAVLFAAATAFFEIDTESHTYSYDCDSDTWTELMPSIQPSPRSESMVAYDVESDRTVLYGGGDFTGDLEDWIPSDEYWAYDLDANVWNNMAWDWINMTPATSPGTRCGSPLVYDVESDRMVLFSGWSDLNLNGSRYNDTWTYDYNSNSWTNMSPPVLPSGRGGHGMAYNEEADVMVMFGGSTGWQVDEARYMADTWTYNLNTNTWTNMSPASNPTPRIYTGMAYDDESDVIVMFGGFMPDHSPSHETWIYNLTSNTWTNATTAAHPEARFGGRMAYDYKNNRILLGSGSNWNGFLGDMWEYDYITNTWAELTSTTPPPSFGFAIAYDFESEGIVASGGPLNLAEDLLVSQTWTFNLTTGEWIDMNSANNPLPRSRLFLAYDIESDRTIMYGGALPDGSYGEALGDTWVYHYQINPPGGPPNLEVTVSGDNLVLTWDAPAAHPSAPVDGYKVYRGTESGVYTLLAELGDVLTYTDTTVVYNTRYYYVVAAISSIGEGAQSNEVSKIILFDILDDDVFSFIAYGDTRGSAPDAVSPLHEEIVSLYLQHDPELILHTGDMVNQGGEWEQWLDFNASIAAVWNAEVPFYGAVGNHEMYTSIYGVNDEDFSNYTTFFDYSSVIDEPGETELYYSFDMNGTHFVFLDTGSGWVDTTYTCSTEQLTWLEADLADLEDDDIIIITFHNPAWSVREGRPDRWAQAESIRGNFHALFGEHGVDIVFTGHDHHYYRTVRDGIQYVTLGGGGAPLYGIQTEDTVWQEGDVGVVDYHYCVANYTASELNVYVYVMNGTLVDSFLIELPEVTTTNTTSTTSEPSPWIMEYVILAAGVGIILILVVLYFRSKR